MYMEFPLGNNIKATEIWQTALREKPSGCKQTHFRDVKDIYDSLLSHLCF